MVLDIQKYNNKISLSPILKKSYLIKAILNYKKFRKEDLYQKLYGSSNCINYGTSTFSLLKLYQFFRDKKRNKILIPDFICNESLSLLRLNQAKIIFYRLEYLDSEELISSLIGEDVRIFLFVNYFGEKKKLSKNFKDLLKKNQIIVIEDKTHCIKSISQIESDIELYSPHKFFGIDNGSIIKFKSKKKFIEFSKYSNKETKDINNKLKNIYRFIFFLLKKEIRKVIGYKYPKLEFINQNPYKIKRNNHIGLLSNNLLALYAKDIKKIITIRKKNYYLWKNNLFLILPFLNMEKLNYCPYLGTARFKITNKRVDILKKYNSFGLPIGTWPDLPPEISRNKIYKKTLERFTTQITIPIHQNLCQKNIKETIKNSFEKYVSNFLLLYDRKLKKIVIKEKEIIIGCITIIENNINKRNMLKLEFNKLFLNTYENSKEFIYILSIKLLSKIQFKELIFVPKKYQFYLNDNKTIIYEDSNFIVPLNISYTNIKNFIHIFLESTYNQFKIERIKNKIHFDELEDLIIYETHNKQNDLYLKIFIEVESNGKYINIKRIKNYIKSKSPSFLLYELAKFLKKKNFEYMKINHNVGYELMHLFN